MAFRYGQLYYSGNSQICSDWTETEENICWCVSQGWTTKPIACNSYTDPPGVKNFRVTWDDSDFSCGEDDAGPYCIDGLKAFQHLFSACAAIEDPSDPDSCAGADAGLLVNSGWDCEEFSEHTDTAAGAEGNAGTETIRNIIHSDVFASDSGTVRDEFVLVCEGTNNVYSITINAVGEMSTIEACCEPILTPVFSILNNGNCDCPCTDCGPPDGGTDESSGSCSSVTSFNYNITNGATVGCGYGLAGYEITSLEIRLEDVSTNQIAYENLIGVGGVLGTDPLAPGDWIEGTIDFDTPYTLCDFQAGEGAAATWLELSPCQDEECDNPDVTVLSMDTWLDPSATSTPSLYLTICPEQNWDCPGGCI